MYQKSLKWTTRDTEICKKAESSGMAINPATGDALTLDDLDNLAGEYDKVRSTTSVDEFFNSKLTSKPFEF